MKPFLKEKAIHQLKQLDVMIPKLRKKKIKADIEKRLDKMEEVLKRQFPQEYCEHEFEIREGTVQKIKICPKCGYLAIIK